MQPDATSLEVKHQSGLSKVCVLREHVEAAPRIVESLGSLGVAAIMTNAAHEARVEADARLRACKEEQKRGLATGADAVGLARDLIALRGGTGSARKSALVAGRSREIQGMGWSEKSTNGKLS